MEKKEEELSVVQRWFSEFIRLLKSLSGMVQAKGGRISNEELSSIGSTPESQALIKELCDDIDDEYAQRRELEQESDAEAWFDRKVDATLDDLAAAGVMDQPSQADYDRAHQQLRDAGREGVAREAKQTADEMNAETAQLEALEHNKFTGKEE